MTPAGRSGTTQTAPPVAVQLVAYGQPQPAGSKRHIGNGRVIDANPRAKEWQRAVAQAAGEARTFRDDDGTSGYLPPLEGPLELRVRFYIARPKGHYGTGRNAGVLRASAPAWPTTRPDCTKLLRGAEDACTGILWLDDAQIVRQAAAKLYGTPARCELQVTELT